MQNKGKGLNRGGTVGQQGDLDQNQPQGNLNQQRDQQRQQGGINREPNLEKQGNRKNIQPGHQVD